MTLKDLKQELIFPDKYLVEEDQMGDSGASDVFYPLPNSIFGNGVPDGGLDEC